MRMLALPAALLLGAALYTLVPGTKTWLNQRLCALPGTIEQTIIKRHKNPDRISILFIYIAGLVIFPTLIGAVHPICAALVMAPLFSGFSPLPAAAKTKQELDSGKYTKDIPEYERQVLAACSPLGQAFALEVAAPMLLCAIGMPLYLGCAAAWVFAGLRANRESIPAAESILAPIERISEGVFNAILLLCAGLVGRNPLNVGGEGAKEKLLHILSLKGEIDHAPISGDITQAIFLCCLCVALLCAALTFVGLLLV